MRVRSALNQDSIAISGLMSQLGYETTYEVISENIKLFESSEFDNVFVVENSKAIILGMISCHVISLFHQSGACGRITSLVVSDSIRGKGIGNLLVEKAESFFKKKNCLRFEVTSGEHRKDAHEFYKSLGYNEDERRFIKHNS